MFVCKICGNEVKPGQAFCATCGADVVENYETVCPVCHAKNSAGSRYCAKCGGILSVMRKPICAVCGTKNLPGAKFCVSCGAPIVAESETHCDADILDARKTKLRLDNMERERMAAVDKEIAEKRQKTAEERETALLQVEDYRKKSEEEYEKKANVLECYRQKLNELGSEDVALLKKMSVALQSYAKYYADPYSQIDEDDIEGETYVCPACGTINPLDATACTHCGRDKARALLLLAKNKIKQCPPVKRKQKIVPPPQADLEVEKTPTLDEFIDKINAPKQEQVAPSKTDEKKEEQADFSGPNQAHFGAYPSYPYPYPPYPYPYAPPAAAQPYPQQASAPQGQPAFYMGADGKPYQMPPIVQPVAFVPYVTQEQPLMQYSPVVEERRTVQKPVVATPSKGSNKKN